MKHLGCLVEACLQADRVHQTWCPSADTWPGRHEIPRKEHASAHALIVVEGWVDVIIAVDQRKPGGVLYR
eukprot:6827516-Pyramimonas_sp.AAC.1